MQSRYYNPEWGRFINADDIGGRVGELLSHNVFAYCANNSISRLDPNGHMFEEGEGFGGGGGGYPGEFAGPCPEIEIPEDIGTEYVYDETTVNQEIDEEIEAEAEGRSVYRGGNDVTAEPDEVKVDKSTGKLKTTHGISVNTNPNKVKKFGGAYKVDKIPKGLNIIQRGGDPGHYEIVPSRPMGMDEYQGLLNKIVLIFYSL